MWFLIYLPAVILVIGASLYYYATKNYNYWEKRNVVGPKPVTLLGNLKDTACRRKFMGTVFKELYNTFPEEKVIGIYRMTTPCLLIRDLDIIKHIMLKDFELFKDRGAALGKRGLARNLFHTDGESWSILRSRLNPMFTPGKLKNMFHLLNDRGDIFINNLDIECRTNPEFEVDSLMKKFTISVIFSCVFGIDIDAFHSEVDESLTLLDKLIVTPSIAIEIDMMFPGIFGKLNLSYFPSKVTKFFENLVKNVISQRKGKPSGRGDFMDLIINMQQEGEINKTYSNGKVVESKSLLITDDIIAAQAFIFYTAGYETSATTLSYLLYQIALNSKIQDRLINEIDNVTKVHNNEITYEALNEMKYLEQAFSETLRMYPVLDPLQRKVKTDYKLPGTDIVIEKNQAIVIPVAGIHYDEKYYPNPEIFDPDRFKPELVRDRHPCAFLPFGVGPRNCIGMRFGTLQSRLCIAKILSKFKVEVCSKTDLKLETNPNKVIIGPKNGIFLNIIPRH